MRGDSARGRPDDSARGAPAGRSQRLSPGTADRFAACAGHLAGIVSTREPRIRLERREFTSVGRLVCLLLPGRENSEGIVAEKLRHRNAPPGGSDLQLVIDEGIVESGACGIG